MAAQVEVRDVESRPSKAQKRAKRPAIPSQIVQEEGLSEDGNTCGSYDWVKQLQPKKDDSDRLATKTNHYASMAVMEAQGTTLSAQEDNRLVRSFMRFMLFRHMQKPGMPVKRDELNKLIPSTYKSQRIHALGKVIAQKAQAQFPSIFGMEMREVNAAKTGQGSDKAYVLRSLLAHPLRSVIRSLELEQSQGLLMIILPLLLLAGGKLSEDDLEMHLRKVGVEGKGIHPILGKLPEVLQMLVQKRYLAETKENGPEGVHKVYAVGALALDEVQAENVKEFMDAVFKKTGKGMA